jgi:hypothetical protein
VKLDQGHSQSIQVFNRLRGRPPLAPLAFAAIAFAFERLRPPRRPVDAANKRVPKRALDQTRNRDIDVE